MNESNEVMDRYFKAMEALDFAKRHMEDLVKRVTDGAAKLKRWRTTLITNIPVPNAVAGAPSGVIDGSLWPTAEQLALGISAHHKAWRELEDCWRALPETVRGGITLPLL